MTLKIYTAFESSALAEKLLNDYLKATEAFNKLKKMNDQLKNQVGTESQYVSWKMAVESVLFWLLLYLIAITLSNN